MTEIKKWRTDQNCEILILDSSKLTKTETTKHKCKKCGQHHTMIIPRFIPIPKLEEVPDLLTQLINSGVTV